MIPPVPRRAVAALAVAIIALVATAAVLLHQAAENQQAARRRAQHAEAARHAAFLASVDREQRPSHGHGPRDPGPAAPRKRRITARTALLASAQARIRLDAVTGTPRHILDVACETFPRTLDAVEPTKDLARPAAAYDCTAVTARFGGGATGTRGIIGIPFRLIARFDTGTFAWCRVVPLPDPDRLTHPLPRACRLR